MPISQCYICGHDDNMEEGENVCFGCFSDLPEDDFDAEEYEPTTTQE